MLLLLKIHQLIKKKKNPRIYQLGKKTKLQKFKKNSKQKKLRQKPPMSLKKMMTNQLKHTKLSKIHQKYKIISKVLRKSMNLKLSLKKLN